MILFKICFYIFFVFKILDLKFWKRGIKSIKYNNKIMNLLFYFLIVCIFWFNLDIRFDGVIYLMFLGILRVKNYKFVN